MPPGRQAFPAARARAGTAATAALLSLALALGACGSSHSTGPGTDPATLTPASAPVYIGAVVRPSGALRDGALTAARTLTGEREPYLRLLALLQTPGSRKLDYARDVRPWLGPRAGAFLLPGAGAGSADIGRLLELLQSEAVTFPFSSGGVGGAVLIDTSDRARAQSFVAAQAARAGAVPRSYRGVPYRATAGGVALGIVDGLVALGSEPALRGVIDTAAGGPRLSAAAGYAALAAAAPADSLARVYVGEQAPHAVGAARGASSASALFSQLAGGRPLSVSLRPSANAIVLDLDTLAPSSQSPALLGSLREGATAFGELPADSWLGVGLGARAGTFGADVRGLRSVLSLLSSGASSSTAQISVKGLLGAFLAPLEALGADTPAARRDFQSWMTSAALFAGGSGLLDLKAGVEIASDNAARSRAAVGKLAAALRRSGNEVDRVAIPGADAAAAAHLPTLPLALDIASGTDPGGHVKFVIGLGEASVTAVLAGAQTLAGGPTASAAAAALGEGISPSATVDFPTLLSLLEGVGLTEDRSIAPLVGYLRALTTLSAGGSQPSGNVRRLRVTIGLRQSGSETASP
jgi:Protein of unknown function (DUF3352)